MNGIRKLEKACCQCAVIFALMEANNWTVAAPSSFPHPGFPVPDGRIFSLLATNNILYVCGDFQTIGNRVRSYLAALDAQNGQVLNWEPDVRRPVSAVAISGNTLYAGYYAPLQLTVYTNALDAFEIQTGQRPQAWAGLIHVFPIPQTFTRVNVLALGHERLYVAGEFIGNFVGATWMSRFIYAFEPTSGAVVAWNPDPNQFGGTGGDTSVDTIGVVGNTLYVGGKFPHWTQGNTRTNLAALDRDTAAALGWDPAPNGRVRSLHVSSNLLFVGGEFTSIGGQFRNGIAAIDLSTGNVASWNPSGTNLNTIRAFGLSGNTVYVAGNFQKIGGQARTNLAALDATTGEATEWHPSVTNQIDALVVSGDTVYVGSSFYPYLGVFPPQGWSVLSQARLTNGYFSFRLLGEEGSNYMVEASTTLTNWSSVYTNTVTNGGFDFAEPATNLAPRFYRARAEP